MENAVRSEVRSRVDSVFGRIRFLMLRADWANCIACIVIFLSSNLGDRKTRRAVLELPPQASMRTRVSRQDLEGMNDSPFARDMTILSKCNCASRLKQHEQHYPDEETERDS